MTVEAYIVLTADVVGSQEAVPTALGVSTGPEFARLVLRDGFAVELTHYFKMRALDKVCDPTISYVHWVVQDAPDLTGALLDLGTLPCGTLLEDITGIEIAAEWYA